MKYLEINTRNIENGSINYVIRSFSLLSDIKQEQGALHVTFADFLEIIRTLSRNQII